MSIVMKLPLFIGFPIRVTLMIGPDTFLGLTVQYENSRECSVNHMCLYLIESHSLPLGSRSYGTLALGVVPLGLSGLGIGMD